MTLTGIVICCLNTPPDQKANREVCVEIPTEVLEQDRLFFLSSLFSFGLLVQNRRLRSPLSRKFDVDGETLWIWCWSDWK